MRKRLLFVIFALLVTSCQPAPVPAPTSTSTAVPASTVQASTPTPLIKPAITQEILKDFEGQFEVARQIYNVPGAAFAIIQDGKVLYARGFGVRDVETKEPFTPDTMFRVASITKSFTSMLAAIQVDDGALDWDTPVSKIFPGFKLPDEQLSKQITVRQVMGMGVGLGANPIELYSDLWTPQYLFDTLKDLPAVGKPGQFLYNNQLYAVAGYLGLLAAGAPLEGLEKAYADLLLERIFTPIGMKTTAVCEDPSQLSKNYSSSYAFFLPDGVAKPYKMPFAPMRAGAPAGSVCTTLNELALYVITQLNKGVAPNSQRVVSEKNLLETWKEQTKINDTSYYGMGWGMFTANGIKVLTHSGGVDGYKTDMTLIPDAGLGIVTFANSESGEIFLQAVRSYQIRKLYQLPMPITDTELSAYQRYLDGLDRLARLVKSPKVEAAAVSDYLGAYQLGWKVEHGADGMLWLVRPSGIRLVLLPVGNLFAIGSGNQANGLGMMVQFGRDEQGKVTMRITQENQVINQLEKENPQ